MWDWTNRQPTQPKAAVAATHWQSCESQPETTNAATPWPGWENSNWSWHDNDAPPPHSNYNQQWAWGQVQAAVAAGVTAPTRVTFAAKKAPPPLPTDGAAGKAPPPKHYTQIQIHAMVGQDIAAENEQR